MTSAATARSPASTRLEAISLGLDASYLNTYSASLAYTDYFGGDYNVNVDRDFVALSFGVAF